MCNLPVGLESVLPYSLKSDVSSCLISNGEYSSSLWVKVGDVYISVLQSCSSPGFSSTFGIADRYSCRKSSNSSSLNSSFTDMSSCGVSVDPDISDFSSVLEKENSQTFIQCKTNIVKLANKELQCS